MAGPVPVLRWAAVVRHRSGLLYEHWPVATLLEARGLLALRFRDNERDHSPWFTRRFLYAVEACEVANPEVEWAARAVRVW